MQYLVKEKIFSTRITDFDCNDNFTMHAILDYFQQMATDHAIDMGISYKELEKSNVHFIMTKVRATLIKNPDLCSVIKVITYPKKKGRLFFDRDYIIKDAYTDQIYAIGTSKWVLVEMGTLKIVRSDRLNYEGSYLDENVYEEDIPKIDISNKNMRKVFSYKVLNSDIDRNHHMNNSKYAKLIFNSYESLDNFSIKDIIINYVTEIKNHQVVDIYKTCIDNEHYFIGKMEDKICFNAKVKGE